jgi:hypothetical protein
MRRGRWTVAESGVTLDTLANFVGPVLLEAGFEDAGNGVSGPYTWVPYRCQENLNGERRVRPITLSFAPEDQALLADSYLVARRTYTYTPVGKELRRYGTPAEAETAAAELTAAVRAWVGA